MTSLFLCENEEDFSRKQTAESEKANVSLNGWLHVVNDPLCAISHLVYIFLSWLQSMIVIISFYFQSYTAKLINIIGVKWW